MPNEAGGSGNEASADKALDITSLVVIKGIW